MCESVCVSCAQCCALKLVSCNFHSPPSPFAARKRCVCTILYVYMLYMNTICAQHYHNQRSHGVCVCRRQMYATLANIHSMLNHAWVRVCLAVCTTLSAVLVRHTRAIATRVCAHKCVMSVNCVINMYKCYVRRSPVARSQPSLVRSIRTHAHNRINVILHPPLPGLGHSTTRV